MFSTVRDQGFFSEWSGNWFREPILLFQLNVSVAINRTGVQPAVFVEAVAARIEGWCMQLHVYHNPFFQEAQATLHSPCYTLYVVKHANGVSQVGVIF